MILLKYRDFKRKEIENQALSNENDTFADYKHEGQACSFLWPDKDKKIKTHNQD